MKKIKYLFNVVLVAPEIPSNTGNIGRTCVSLYSRLHLVGPLGFEMSDKRLKRAGLDYWPHLNYKIYDCWEEIKPHLESQRVFYLSTKGEKSLYEAHFRQGDCFVFGSESKGLSDHLLKKQTPSQVLKIPSPGPVRSLNLANAVSVTTFEAFRQVCFDQECLDIDP